MKDNKEATLRNFEIVERLKSIREELIGMKESSMPLLMRM